MYCVCDIAGDGDLSKRVADLKCEVREQKDRIRSLQRELKQRNVDNEAVSDIDIEYCLCVCSM